MSEIFYAFLVGLVIGGVFSLLKLPIPAPQTLAGIMGIVGLFFGYILASNFLR